MENKHTEAFNAFIQSLDRSIEFHRDNENDPHGVGNAVMIALIEVKNAAMKASHIYNDPKG